MCTTGSEDAVTVQAGTFSWDRNERPVLEKCIAACVCGECIIISYITLCVCVCVCVCVCPCILCVPTAVPVYESHYIHRWSFIQLLHHLQYQSEHQAWSVGGSSGSCGSW